VVIVVGASSLIAAAMVFVRHPWSLLLAIVAGLILIGSELLAIAVVGQFTAIVVIIGLAVIALAEYLWTTEARPQQRPTRHKVIRLALLILEAFIAVSAIDGGMALRRGAFDEFLSVAWLAGTPFEDYAVPSLVLVIVVGGSALFAAATVFIYREWAVLTSVVAGLVLAGFLVVEAVSIDSKIGSVLPMVVAMQVLYFVPGLAIVGLAGFVWLVEYRGRRVHRMAASGDLGATPLERAAPAAG
jgi:hypothetical protein